MGILDTIFDFIFPVRCIQCGMRGTDLCFPCLYGSPAAERESAEWIFPLYDYRHATIKRSVWLLKYKGKKGLARTFAEPLYETILEELSELSVLQNFRDPILVPIPLSPGRSRGRGYNQAELICREIIKINDLRHGADMDLAPDILIKPKDTLHQARLKDRNARLKNLVGSFAIKNDARVKGKNIILIDDILTTGATLTEAKKVLKKAGARKVIAFTVAH